MIVCTGMAICEVGCLVNVALLTPTVYYYLREFGFFTKKTWLRARTWMLTSMWANSLCQAVQYNTSTVPAINNLGAIANIMMSIAVAAFCVFFVDICEQYS